MPDWTVSALLKVSADYLAAKTPESPRLDAELLLAEVLEVERVQLYVQHDRPLTPAEVDSYRSLVARRVGGEPVAHILGRAAFRYVDLVVDSSVLIPRPETEELVDAALESLSLRPPFFAAATPDGPAAASGEGDEGRAKADDRGESPTAVREGGEAARSAAKPGGWLTPVVADVGTGSGAIACSLAMEAGVRVIATDDSPEALDVASRNVALLGLERAVELKEADLLEGAPPDSLRLVVSNPPYVTEAEYAGLDPHVRDFEPAAALVAGQEGLDVYRRLVPTAFAALGPGGALMLEVGHTQARAVVDLLEQAGFTAVATRRDLSGKERIVWGIKPGAVARREGVMTPWEEAAVRSALKRGAVVGLPTDTVYGLAAAYESGPGVKRIFEAKGRRPEQPIAALFSSAASVFDALPDLDPRAVRVLEDLLPGPYTFVVETRVPRPPLVGTEDSLGVRVPDHPGLLRLLERVGTPVAATSANRSGGADPTGLIDVDPDVLAHCSIAFTGGEPARGVASTVVDLRPLSTGLPALVLREGAVARDEIAHSIERALGR